MYALAGSVLGVPGRTRSERPLRIEYWPVISAARDGVHAGLDQVLRQSQPLASELVDARRRASSQLAAAVWAHVAVADVVGQG